MTGAQRSRGSAIVDQWCVFWFTPRPAYTLGLVRMAFGALVVAWTLAALPDVLNVFGERGAAPQFALDGYRWSIFGVWPGDTALLTGWAILLVSAIALAVGWHARVAAVGVFVLLYSFFRRGPYLYNAGDSLMVITALVLVVSSCGAALSLDQRRRTGSFWSAQTSASWPIRLLQVQLTLIYLVSVQAKLSGKAWVDGSALFYAWHTDGRWALLPVPEWLSTNAVLGNLLTWAALLVELSVAVLVWNRRCRPWVLALGVLLHLSIMLTLHVAYFSLAMYVLYLAFVPWRAVHAMPGALKARWHDRRRAGPSARSTSTDGTAAP